MPVEKVIPQKPPVMEPSDEELEIEFIEQGEEVEYEEDDDSYGDLNPEFGANLAEDISPDKLTHCAEDLITEYESDVKSREEWKNGYIDGLKYLGMSNEDRAEPWDGASGVFHPLLTEALVRFQSQAILEIFPAAGPARTKIVGKATPPKTLQAGRVEEELNYILTEVMSEYRSETEQLLFRLPLSGSVFRKVYFDEDTLRPVAVMVSAEDFVVPYAASDLKTAERYTHVMKKSFNEIKKLMANGFYRTVEIDEEATPDYSEIEDAHDEISGRNPSVYTDSRHTLLEMHVDYDFGEEASGIAIPYVITIHKDSNEILSIRRNWIEEDPSMSKRIHFAHYQYMPGLGFYGIGLVHLIGGLAQTATSLLRQLIDAGTLSNLPAGFKTRGFRTLDKSDEPFSPGEFRDIDVPAGKIGENIFVLPFKEPSPTLYQLLQTVVDEGRRIASIADIEIGEFNAQSPVGTTLAMLERSMKVMSAVHARLHAALKEELRLISGLIGSRMGPEYEYDEELQFNRQEDFSSKVDIFPVSDPNASTMSHRIMQMQAAWQMAQQDPEGFNKPLLKRKMLEAMNIDDAEELVPLPPEIPPTDPVTENQNLITGKPTKVYPQQDHESHIQVHMAAMMDPQMQALIGQSVQAAAIQGAFEAHMAEHLGFRYRQQVEEELGTALPPPGEPMEPEAEVKLSRLVADAANRLFYRHQEEAQRKQNEQLLQDPIVQMQMRELALKEAEFEHKKKIDEEKLKDADLDRESRATTSVTTAIMKLAEAEDDRLSEEAMTAIKIGADLKKAEIQADTQEKNAERQAQVKEKQAKKAPAK